VGFFSRGKDDDAAQAESLARVTDGGIPSRAQARLTALATEGSLFTSGLSVNEFALLQQMGPQPLAQVMGASVIRTGWQYLPALEPGVVVNTGSVYSPSGMGGSWNRSPYTEASPAQVRAYKWHAEVVCELDELSDAWRMAQRRALDRLSEEALQVGADAVVGVHLHHSDHDLGRRTIEYVVTGTAIRLPGSTGASWPTLSALSVQDYWRLLSTGHDPVGFVATSAVVFASPPRATRARRARTTSQNQELEEISRAFRDARETVRNRLLGQVSDARGAGAVGVEFSHSVHREKLSLALSLGSRASRGWQKGSLGLPYYVSGHSDVERRGWVITMHAAGTAIRRRTGQSPLPVKTAMRMGAI
jgi:uncharacterized protein YbjQ (UPF0145 family)